MDGVRLAAVLFVIGTMLLALAGRRMEQLRAEVAARPMRSIALGCSGVLGGVVVVIALCVTVIGIPVARRRRSSAASRCSGRCARCCRSSARDCSATGRRIPTCTWRSAAASSSRSRPPVGGRHRRGGCRRSPASACSWRPAARASSCGRNGGQHAVPQPGVALSQGTQSGPAAKMFVQVEPVGHAAASSAHASAQ